MTRWSVLALGMMLAQSVNAQPQPVLLDVDPGTDDALALLLALRSPELDVVAITTVAGNVEVDVGVQNALKIAELAGRPDIPVARGAESPLVGKLITSKHVHGDNGLADFELPPPSAKPHPTAAVDLIAEKVHQQEGKIVLIPVGPLTNIALALKLHPELVSKIERIVLMGGSLSGGNITPAAEFNIFVDPEAAEMVFSSGVPIVMVGLDVTEKTVLTRQHLDGVERTEELLHRLVRHITNFHIRRRNIEGIMLHDPLAVGVVIDQTFVQTRKLHVDVETKGEKTRGETVPARQGFKLEFSERDGVRTVTARRDLRPNVDVCVEVDSNRFIELFLNRVLAGP